MMLIVTLTLVVCVALVWISYRLVRAEPVPVPELVNALDRANVAAISSLMSRSEHDYLRHHLAPKDFARLHRMRMAAARAYLREFDALCARLGSSLRGQAMSDDLQAIADDLTLIRFTIFKLYATAWISSLIPSIHSSARPILDFHEHAMLAFRNSFPNLEHSPSSSPWVQ
jgi:hypothetical protein